MAPVEELLGDGGLLLRFVDTVKRHGDAEFSEDLDQTLATVCDRPFYTFTPLGWAIHDKILLRDFYAVLIPTLNKMEPRLGGAKSMFFGPTGIVIWDQSLQFRHEDARVTPVNLMVAIIRDADTGLVSGEHAFMNNDLAAIFSDMVGPHLARRLTDAAKETQPGGSA